MKCSSELLIYCRANKPVHEKTNKTTCVSGKDSDQIWYTVKPVDKTKILMTNGSLMNVESIAECFTWNIQQYF